MVFARARQFVSYKFIEFPYASLVFLMLCNALPRTLALDPVLGPKPSLLIPWTLALDPIYIYIYIALAHKHGPYI